MKIFMLRVIILSALVGGAGSLHAQSALDTPCITQSLASYLSAYGPSTGAGCSVGIQNFENFLFASSGSGTLDTAAQIKVTPQTGGFEFSQFIGQFNVLDNQTAYYQINYEFVIDPAPTAGGASLGMDPVYGNVLTNQYYCADSFLTSNQNAGYVCQVPQGLSSPPQQLHVDNTNPPNSLVTGYVPLNPVVLNFATVQTNIALDGTGLVGGSGFDSVTGDSFITGTTPEPFTFLLAAGGLLTIIVCKRISHVSS